MDEIFEGVSGLVQIKDAALSYAPLVAEHFNTLTQLSNSRGYWVNVSSPATLTVSGAVVDPATVPIALQSGWNIVSYLPDSDLTPATALASISSNLLELRYTDASAPVTSMQPGKGYWIKVSAPCTLIYP